MSIVQFFSVFLVIVGACWSYVPPSQKLVGIWTVHRILAIKENDTDVYSCYKVTNEVVNDTTINTTLNYKLNGELHTIESLVTLKSIDKTDGETFLVEQYAYIKDGLYGIREWCVSLNRTAPEEIIEKCPASKKYKELDNFHCLAWPGYLV